MEKIIEKRREMRKPALNKAKRFIECVNKKLRVHKAVLIGSYARGDFNRWSDIDILLIVEDDPPDNPLSRLDLIADCLYIGPLIEPILLTIEEYGKLKRKNNPIVSAMIKYGIVLHEE